MDKIEVKVLNPEVIVESEKMMVTAARLTQSGHTIKNMDDFVDLYRKGYKPETASMMASLPHPTIQKFGVINVVVVGASRRFLAQITRHQNEVKFMSASLQYSDYSDDAAFVVPYSLLDKPILRSAYLVHCETSMERYKILKNHIPSDEAGYITPQGLRNVLIISATPYQLKHMIKQRICRRNTEETRYVMLLIARELQKAGSALFEDLLPNCCKEGKFSCGHLMLNKNIGDYISEDFPKIK